jgi:hypothetical protein
VSENLRAEILNNLNSLENMLKIRLSQSVIYTIFKKSISRETLEGAFFIKIVTNLMSWF